MSFASRSATRSPTIWSRRRYALPGRRRKARGGPGHMTAGLTHSKSSQPPAGCSGQSGCWLSRIPRESRRMEPIIQDRRAKGMSAGLFAVGLLTSLAAQAAPPDSIPRLVRKIEFKEYGSKYVRLGDLPGDGLRDVLPVQATAP